MRSNVDQRTYYSWVMMRNRCNNPKAEDWDRYGGRGINIDPRWSYYGGFLLDMGVRPKGKTLERRDNNADYTPDNCYWGTYQQQARNRGQYNQRYEFGGEKLHTWEWAEKLKIRLMTFHHRLWRWRTGQSSYEDIFIPNPRA